MRKKLSDEHKYDNLIIIIVYVVLLGVFGGYLVHSALECPQLTPFILSIFLILVIICVVTLCMDTYKKTLKKCGMTQQQLEREYQAADEVYKNALYVSDNYLISKYGLKGFIVCEIDDIVWMYKEYVRDVDYFMKKEYYIVFHTKKQKKCYLFVPWRCYEERETDKILDYFRKRFPHILVGYSKEAKQMFKQDFNAFLQVKYNYGIKKREHERKSVCKV